MFNYTTFILTLNSWTTYATDTNLEKSTALDDLVSILEAHSSKPLVTRKPVFPKHCYNGHNYAC